MDRWCEWNGRIRKETSGLIPLIMMPTAVECLRLCLACDYSRVLLRRNPVPLLRRFCGRE